MPHRDLKCQGAGICLPRCDPKDHAAGVLNECWNPKDLATGTPNTAMESMMPSLWDPKPSAGIRDDRPVGSKCRTGI